MNYLMMLRKITFYTAHYNVGRSGQTYGTASLYDHTSLCPDWYVKCANTSAILFPRKTNSISCNQAQAI